MYEHKNQPPDIIVGETDFRGEHKRFGMYNADRMRHVWVIGKTGSGKSTLLTNLIAQDLAHGRGVGVLDPHGDLARTVLHLVPKSRTNQVAYVDPSDQTHALAFNILRQGRSDVGTALTAASLISVFKKHWSDMWGPRLEHVLRNAILAVAPDPRATLLFLYRFLTDEQLRVRLGPRIQDPVVRQFWTVEFPGYRAALQAEALSPVLNKLGAFVTNPFVRRIVAQEKSRLDLGELIEARGILVANLSVGEIGEDASHLLGSLLVSAVQTAAMRRTSGEPPFYLYIDEFQHFVTDSLATVLSEARKFGVGLTLSHQYLAQLPPKLLDAVRGNVGSLVVMRLGAEDASILEREIHPPFVMRDLVSLPFGRVLAKVTVRGTTLAPFSARMLPPVPVPSDAAGRMLAISEQSRRRFSTPATVVDQFVNRMFTNSDDLAP